MSWLRTSSLAVLALAMIAGGCGKMSYSAVTGTNTGPQNTGFQQKTVVVDGVERKFGLFIPHTYNASKQWPVVVFLHGVLEGGSDGESQLTVGLGPNIAKIAPAFNMIGVFPQSPGDWVGEDKSRIVMACLDKVQREYSTDPGCVTLTGVSNGGQGVWIVGARNADRFSALVPMCGYQAYDFVPQLVKVPVWCFHNSGDFLVGSGQSDEMCKRIKDLGGNVKYTKMDGMGHNCWDEAFETSEVFKWMVAQRRGSGGMTAGMRTNK